MGSPSLQSSSFGTPLNSHAMLFPKLAMRPTSHVEDLQFFEQNRMEPPNDFTRFRILSGIIVYMLRFFKGGSNSIATLKNGGKNISHLKIFGLILPLSNT